MREYNIKHFSDRNNQAKSTYGKRKFNAIPTEIYKDLTFKAQ